ncbi:MAG: SDR family NAD(P)-dependent oxidoreductase [Lachnospiraceae bacterium]|nr:SDR family NAD(P)-dependent oxidoreductase [Lachnospiraceae bacterium]MDE6981354.1 SDR family NAD(P)-dependent oxidoreductase [Lachnospiraceae bacterium]
MANILIVGANQGIGYYLAEKLLELGNFVTVLDIHTDNVLRLKEKYQKSLLPVIADARDLSSIENGVKQALQHFGDIDIAVHNACLCTFESESDSGYEVYQSVMDVNYFGALRLAKTVLPHMRKAKKGRIIFTSSGVGVTGFSNISPYAASKGAIESLAKCLEIENEEYGISFHLFHPPLTNTNSASGIPVPKEFKAEAKKVGYGLAARIWSKKFVICHSKSQAAQMNFSYRHPLYIGKMMTRAAKKVIS